jgi:AcrR family transcriptional regulator
MSASERHADRRARLVEAGLEIFGSEGFAGSTIEAICRRAGVTARNFYDHFESREDLLATLYTEIIAEQAAAVAAALEPTPRDVESHVRGGIEATVKLLAEDERKGRIAYVEVVGASRELEAHRIAVMSDYARLMAAQFKRLIARGLITKRPVDMTATALLGATIFMTVDWLSRRRRPPIEDVVDELVRIYVAALTDEQR